MIRHLALCLGVALASSGLPSSASADSPVRYRLTFVPTWTAASHPLEYPSALPRRGHLSPLIGGTHSTAYRILEIGKAPTPGLELVSERGKHDLLEPEIRAAMDAGTVGTLIQADAPIMGETLGTSSVSFEIDEAHPMVSVFAMLAPSPDWFTGVDSLSLRRGDVWVPTATVVANAWDSGGDTGTTYLADDADTHPKESMQLAGSPHFVHAGEPTPVGVFVFTRIP